jgi:site-specific DNA recombinase
MGSPKVGVYARISLDRADGAGVERQLADCLALAARRGWEVVETYVDNSESAYKAGHVRPEYERMMTDLRGRRLDGLVVWNIDRLYRKPRELEDLLELAEDGQLAFGVVGGDYDLATSDGRFVARLMVNVANKSSADTARRMARKVLADAQAGKPHGGQRPWGYEADRVTVNPAEAAVIRECCGRLIGGASLRQVALDLNRRGLTGARGARWQVTSLTRALTSLHLVGVRVHHGEEYPGSWPAILTREERANVLASIGERQLTRIAYRRHLLSGFVFCGVCGTRLQARTRTMTYECPAPPQGGRCVSVAAATLEAHVLAQVSRYAMRRPAEQPEAAHLDLSDLEERRRALIRVFAAGMMTERDLQVGAAAITDQIASAEQAAIASVKRPRVRLLDGWDALDIDEQRAELAQHVSRIEVGRGVRGIFDSSRIGMWTADGEGWDTVDAELATSEAPETKSERTLAAKALQSV